MKSKNFKFIETESKMMVAKEWIVGEVVGFWSQNINFKL